MIFAFHWGIFGAALATALGQVFSFLLAVRYLWRFKTIRFEKSSFRLDAKEIWDLWLISQRLCCLWYWPA